MRGSALETDLDTLPVGILTVDRRLMVRHANEQGRRLLGLRRGSPVALGRRLLDGLGDADRERLLAAMAEAPVHRGVASAEVRWAGRGGTVRVMQVQARARARSQEVVLACVDITRQRRAADRAEHAARHDALTGLPNRAQAMRQLSQALQRARAIGSAMALMFVDLDRFKAVNDTHGHAAGDRLLCEVAHRLREASRPDGQPARLGGDEFLVLLPQLVVADEARKRAERVAHGLRQPLRWGNGQIRPSASIGVSRFPEDAADVRGLMHHADLALYRAKRDGRDGVRVYDPALDVLRPPAIAAPARALQGLN